MENILTNIVSAIMGAIIGSGITIPIMISIQSRKKVMKQRGGNGASMTQVGRDLNER